MSLVSVLAVASVVLLACFAASSASAAKVHVYATTLGTGELSLTPQSGVAVDQESGEVYVADTKNGRVAKFIASGNPDGSLASISEPTFIAVDNSAGPSKGDIYVVGEAFGTVTKLSPLGLPISGWGTEELGERKGRLSGLSEIAGISVDPLGDLWVFSREGSRKATMREFGQAEAGQEAEAGNAIAEFTVEANGEPREWTELPMFASGIGMHGIAAGSDQIFAFQDDLAENSATLERLNLAGGPDEGITPGSPFGRANFVTDSSNGVAINPSDEDFYVSDAAPSGSKTIATQPPNIVRYPLDVSDQALRIETFGGAYEGLSPDATRVVDKLKTIGQLAIRPSTGDLYAVDPLSSDVALYALEEVEPPTVTLDSVTSQTQTSAVFTGHIDPLAPTGSSRSHEVVWHFECTPSCPGQEVGHFEADGQIHNVTTTISGLEAGTEYSVELVAENRGGQSSSSQPVITEAAPPTVIDNAPTEIFRGEATLNAKINSNGAETTYHFEYMTKEAFEAEGFEGARTESIPGTGALPSPAMFRPVSPRIADLESNTEYIYRAVAQNSLGTTDGTPVPFHSQFGANPLEADCPNEALRTDAGRRLPDCRAYELVTPTEKLGSAVETYPTGLQVAADGSGVTWYTGQTATGIPSPQGAHPSYAFYLSSRVGENWESQRLLAPEEPGRTTSYLVGLTGDTRYALIETATDAKTFGEPALYLLNTTNHELTTIVPPQVGVEVGSRVFALDGGSATDSLIFFESRLQLTSDAAPEKNSLYVWNRETGALSLAGVLPGSKSEAPAGGSFGGAYSWWGSHPNLSSGGAEEALYVEAVHAISENGDSVYFTAGETGQVYLRHGLTTAKPTTVRVSVANSGVTDPNGQKPAAFQEATPDGSKAFFLSSGKLTQNANTGVSDEGSDLYRYEAAAKTPLVDVTPLLGGAGARVQGLLGASADGRSGYFVAQGVLAPGGVEGDSNVYHFQEEGEDFSYTFIANLGETKNTPAELNWSPIANQQKSARVSQDGNAVMFMSERALTGYSGSCLRGECLQVYRYSMAEGELACLSCNPTGEPSPFGAELNSALGGLVPENRIRTKTEPGNAISGILPTFMSASGARVFFQASAALLPEDVNGSDAGTNCPNQGTCVDVYEWEAPDPSDPTDTCHSNEQNGGCLYLLSTGESGRSSYFVNASADGSSAFIITSSSLVPADQDELPDVYDARVDGGLASQHATEPEPCSSSGACRGPSPSPPPSASAGSSTFQGPGNPSLKKCKKGSALKKGKCVKNAKKHKAKKHKAKKHKAKSKKKKGRSTGKRSGGSK